MTSLHLLVLLVTGLASRAIVGKLIQVSRSEGILIDEPNTRSSHSDPTPRGGGIAIAILVLLGLLLVGVFSREFDWSTLGPFLLAGSLVAVIGWLDDLYSLPSTLRFVFHAASAVLIVVGVGWWQGVDLPVAGEFRLGLLGLPVTFLWLTGLTNIYNFMDGIDGIAGGQAIVAALGWLILAFRNDCSWLVWICVLILGSTAGFLSLNWQPAKVFMGDVASGFLGFAFGSISVLYSRHSSSSAAASIFFLWPFVFDGVYTIIRRLFAKEDIFSAHRSHIYQRLVITGLSHSKVSLIYFLISLVCVISVHLWIVYERAAVFPLTVVLSSSFGLLCWVKLRERSSLVASPS